MPKIFESLRKVRPVYDVLYKILMLICKLFLIVDILITPDIKTVSCQAYAAVLLDALPVVVVSVPGHNAALCLLGQVPSSVSDDLRLLLLAFEEAFAHALHGHEADFISEDSRWRVYGQRGFRCRER